MSYRLPYKRVLAIEPLECRQLLTVAYVPAPQPSAATSDTVTSTTLLDPFSISQDSGLNAQSKVWSHGGSWWAVLPSTSLASGSGTYVWRLDGTAWTPVLKLAGNSNYRADVLAVGDVTHILLDTSSHSKLVSVEYVPGAPGTYALWSAPPTVATVSTGFASKTATIAMDSTGRMWMSEDNVTDISVRYSDAPYATWSDPINLASNTGNDEISVITALPNGTVGVLWSNHLAERFGFRYHVDGQDPAIWSADEVPASQSALDIGHGMADDHLNVKVGSDGTLYAAVKTGYDSMIGFPEMALLVRRPNGVWDPLYSIDTHGTRPVILLDEADDRLLYTYTGETSYSNIDYKYIPLSDLDSNDPRKFEAYPKQTLLSGSFRDPTTTKQSFTDEVVFLTTSSTSMAAGVKLTESPVALNQPPIVDAGNQQTIQLPASAQLDATISDDGKPPVPGTVFTTWSKVSGPGTVTFDNPLAVDTIAHFTKSGTYVLRLTADDGEYVTSDELTIVVNPAAAVTTVFQDGLFPDANYSGTRDTRLVSDDPATVHGTKIKLKVNGNPPEATLLHWDLSAIIPGSTIENGSIEVNVTEISSASYEVYAMLQPWVEGEANWNEYSTGNSWQDPGASGSADHGSTVVGVLSGPVAGTATITLNAAGIALVQSWLDNPQTNHGFIIQNYLTHANGIAFSSREATNTALRPKLNLTYLPGEPPPVPNTAPVVDAGANQAVQFPGQAQLDATVTDDGQPVPPAAVATLWTVVSGPGGVTFDNASAVDTVAHFNAVGTYVLRLTANDGELVTSDDVTIILHTTTPESQAFQDGAFPSGSYSGTRDAKIKSDDPNGQYGTKTKLKVDGSPPEGALLQWDVTGIAPGSTVQTASINLNVTEVTGGTYELYAMSQPWVENEVTWNVYSTGNSWEAAGGQGAADRGSTVIGVYSPSAVGIWTITLNAAGISLVQSWIDNPSSNHGLIIQDYATNLAGSGFNSREATNPSLRPKLNVNYLPGDPPPVPNSAPVVDAGSNQAVQFPGQAQLDATVTDDGKPEPPVISTLWTVVSGPGGVTFDDASAVDTVAHFDAVGTYVLRLTANDGELLTSDDVTILLHTTTPESQAFQDGAFPSGSYSGTRDAKIKSDDPNGLYGTKTKLKVDGSPPEGALLKWDVTGIAPGSTVQTASIHLNVTEISAGSYELYAMSRAWVENEVTWNVYSTGNSWEAAGGQGVADRGSEVIGVYSPSAVGILTITLNAAGIILVQSWIDNPSSNHGVIIQDYTATAAGSGFNSREALNPSLRPKLNVGYLPPEPSQSMSQPAPPQLPATSDWTSSTAAAQTTASSSPASSSSMLSSSIAIGLSSQTQLQPATTPPSARGVASGAAVKLSLSPAQPTSSSVATGKVLLAKSGRAIVPAASKDVIDEAISALSRDDLLISARLS